jgi:hypothetical protein
MWFLSRLCQFGVLLPTSRNSADTYLRQRSMHIGDFRNPANNINIEKWLAPAIISSRKFENNLFACDGSWLQHAAQRIKADIKTVRSSSARNGEGYIRV